MAGTFRSLIGISEHGYEWVTRDKGACVLLPKLGTHHLGEWDTKERCAIRSYNPIEYEPALFWKFAELAIDGISRQDAMAAMAAFADKYGCIRSDSGKTVEDYSEQSVQPKLHYPERDDLKGPTVGEWRQEADKLRAAIDLWKAIDQQDVDTLRQFVTWSPKGDLLEGPRFSELGRYAGSPWIIQIPTAEPKDSILLGKNLLGYVLSESTSDFRLFARWRPNEPMAVRVTTSKLESVLWMQLALAISKNKQYRRCEVCDEPFEVAPEVNRADRTICSDACRARAYRRRIARARELRADGKTLRQIVKDVGSNMKTIKRWLGEDK